MEKPARAVINGGMKLPVGYRFHPTDEELVVHYLRSKVFHVPLPASVIPELDVFQADPWNLPGDLKEKRYFFGRKLGHESENRCERKAGCGYWKPVGKGRPIIASVGNHLVGIKRTLVFCQQEHSNQSRTRWIMHEYRLSGSGTMLNTAQVLRMKLGDWAVYGLFQKKKSTKKTRGGFHVFKL